jgi:predicted nucleotidyltransferase
MIEPIMSISVEMFGATALVDALFSKIRQRVLSVLFSSPDRSFYATEIINLVQAGSGGVQRELASLTAAGFLTVRKQGNQQHYQVNKAIPIYDELRGIVMKTMGLSAVLRSSLLPLAEEIRVAFVFGSIASKGETFDSDVDVLIISDNLAYGTVFSALESAAISLGRKVNPVIYSSIELAQRVKNKNGFVSKVMLSPKIWLIGTEADLLD